MCAVGSNAETSVVQPSCVDLRRTAAAEESALAGCVCARTAKYSTTFSLLKQVQKIRSNVGLRKKTYA